MARRSHIERANVFWRTQDRVLCRCHNHGVARPIGRLAARSTKVPNAPLHWKLVKGPWFDNNLATLEITGEGLRMWWAKGRVEGGAHHRPRLVTVSDVTIESRQPSHR